VKADPFLAQFGRNVARARRRAGLTQEGLRDLSDIHPTEISRIENGRINVKVKTVERLASFLDVTPGQLLDGRARSGATEIHRRAAPGEA
jgi:transcriptional regulator with XRE-family HTH domain